MRHEGEPLCEETCDHGMCWNMGVEVRGDLTEEEPFIPLYGTRLFNKEVKS